MDVSRSEMVDVVRRVLPMVQFERSAIYWYKRVIPKGEPLRAGPQTFTMPFDGYLVFVDLAPGANWAHPCNFVLVGIDALSTQVIDSSFPPAACLAGDDPIVLQPAPKPRNDHRGRASDS